jgi:signal transduction histidine kinase
MIEAVVPLAQITQAEAAVFAQHATSGTTVLEWLKTPPARHSPSTMTETLAKIHFLKALGADRWAFDAIPIEKQRAYGQRIQARRPAKVRELKTSTRTIELVFFLRVTLLELTDAMAYQSGRRVSDLVRRAYNQTTAKQVRSAVEYRQQLVDIKALVDDTRRSAEARLADIGKLLQGFSAKPPASHAASVREMLTEDQHRIRNLLTALRGLEFASNGSDPAVQQLEFIGSLHDQGATELPRDCQVPVSASWRDMVNGEDRKRAR